MLQACQFGVSTTDNAHIFTYPGKPGLLAFGEKILKKGKNRLPKTVLQFHELGAVPCSVIPARKTALLTKESAITKF